MAVAEKLLQKNMDTDMNQKLVAECLKSFDKQAAAGKQG
jgi:F-type H+-transporting ATPase subunit b